MRYDPPLALALFTVALLGPASGATRAVSPGAPERIEANENLRSGGTLRGSVLTLRLETRTGMWHPDGDGGPAAAVPAFGEAGRALQIPGPMIRAPAGTEVVVTIRNSVADGALTVHGLVSRPLPPGSARKGTVHVAPGASREVRFRLDAPGTYYYWGTTTGRPFAARTREDAQLSGAIVVDEPGRVARPDRVMVIGAWADTSGLAARDDGLRRERLLLVVNGRSWPHTSRLSYAVGDTVRWRVINASFEVHPMHLHGFYFGVTSRGDGITDSLLGEDRRDMVVTERMLSGRTFAMSWIPEREGNWLFHCHFPTHFEARGPLGMARDNAPDAHAHHVANHALQGMSGLVLGVHVEPRRGERAAPAVAADPSRRRIRLLVRPAGGTEALPLYSYALHEGGEEPVAVQGARSGPPIVLTRGVPVSITVVNRTPEQTSVHWHGMELDSYFDGVSGFSGSPAKLSPIIAPADSFEARFTPPRAGTFIYHTHVHEMRQQPAGLAGPLIVVDPDRPFDPTTDIPILISSPRQPADEKRSVLLNGMLDPTPLDVRVGVPLRLRFINITTGRPGMRMDLFRDSTLVAWRPVAKDGADLPRGRQIERTARQPISIGETFDFEFTPTAAGEYRLEGWTGNSSRMLARLRIRATESGRAGGR